MEESLVPSPLPGPAELCVGDCSADFRTQSEQLYSFVVSVLPARPGGVADPARLPPPPRSGHFSRRRRHSTA